MSEITALGPLAAGAIGAFLGAALGLIHLRSLRHTVWIYVSGGRTGRALVATALRLCGALFVFVVLTRWGVAPALGGIVGFSCTRAWVLPELG